MPTPAATMTYADVLEQMQAVRSDQIATIFSRRNPEVKTVGVRFGDIDKLAKKIKKNSALAAELWDSGVMEEREIACRIIEPESMDEAQIDQWSAQLNYPTVTDTFASVVYRTRFGRKKMEEWTQRTEEFVRRAGFNLLYQFAADPKSDLSDEEATRYLDQIGREIHDSANWAREMMNMAPIAIGKRNEALYPLALAVASGYGKVSVFHGDKTNCKVWNAADALQDPRVHAKRP